MIKKTRVYVKLNYQNKVLSKCDLVAESKKPQMLCAGFVFRVPLFYFTCDALNIGNITGGVYCVKLIQPEL